MLPFDGFALTPTLLPEAARNGTAATRPTGPAGPLAAVARGTRRLLAGWLALAVGSLWWRACSPPSPPSRGRR
jgi:hypothetical protein